MNKTDTKIIELKNGGKSLRQIAKQVGISHVAVKKRLDKLTANETCNQDPEASTIKMRAERQQQKKGLSKAIKVFKVEKLKTPHNHASTDLDQIWGLNEFPGLNHAVNKIDGLMMDIEQFVRSKLETTESKSITIETPNGWKIEKIPTVG